MYIALSQRVKLHDKIATGNSLHIIPIEKNQCFTSRSKGYV